MKRADTLSLTKLVVTLLYLFLVFALTACAASSKTRPEQNIARVDRFLSDGVDQGFSGAALIALEGQVVLNKGYGLANKKEQISFTSYTVFSIGSVSKQFTAAAILTLVDRNLLNLKETITAFFPELEGDKKRITVHHLLTHSSGLVHGIGKDDFDRISTDEYFDALFQSELLSSPGSKHHYSNAGYSVLARIVELVSGQDYEAYLSKYLFQPAGMRNTGYFLPNWDQRKLAQGYARNVVHRGTLIERFKNDGAMSWNLKGNGGIHSTQNDMFRWYLALRNNSILSSKLSELFTTPYIPESDTGDSHYAYGWAVGSTSRGSRSISHNGGNGVFYHEFIWLPEEDAAIIFTTNATSPEVELTWTIERMLFDSSYEPRPIRKNALQYIYEFAQTYSPTELSHLESKLSSDYERALTNPSTLNRMGYLLKRSLDDSAWAIALFKLNTRLFPHDANVWDSLGDGYRASGQNDLAMKSYAKAISLGSQQSEKKLLELTRP